MSSTSGKKTDLSATALFDTCYKSKRECFYAGSKKFRKINVDSNVAQKVRNMHAKVQKEKQKAADKLKEEKQKAANKLKKEKQKAVDKLKEENQK